MCGINGIAYSSRAGRDVDADLLVRMRDVQHHRGPDEAGVFTDRNIGLGHRRLSIVDLKSGQQPMFNHDRSCVITYNGEVYNHGDFRRELSEKGYEYRTTSDTETILHLYEEYGPDCVQFLRGMFAFAIWDGNKRELFIARDRLGVKPLYYVHDQNGSLFFASEIKAILEADGVKPELNYDALPDQFANHGTSYDETLFKGVKRLLPGHSMLWKDGRLEIEQYWDVRFAPKHEDRSDEALVEEWLDLFRKSVELRLMADVPLGMFLSGGIDSSAICAMMAKMVDGPIKTFSVGFKEQEANEFRYARMVSEKFKTEHHEITITPEQYFAELPKLIWHEDEPIGFVASVPLYFVSKLAQRHVKVVLTGEGSDEMLGGYARYRTAIDLLNYGRKYEAVLPSFMRAMITSGVLALPNSVNRKLMRTFLTRPADIEHMYFDNFSVFPKAMQKSLFSAMTKERVSDESPYALQKRWASATDAEQLLDKLLYADTKTYLHELLMKQDQMSMAASIESRVPFLDHRLIEFTAKLPTRFKLRGRDTKWILRKAMKSILPEEILSRSKVGFPVPVGRWFRSDFRSLVAEYITSERALGRGIFDPEFVRELVARHNSGENHDQRLFSLMTFEIWQRQFFEGEAADPAGSIRKIQEELSVAA